MTLREVHNLIVEQKAKYKNFMQNLNFKIMYHAMKTTEENTTED